MYGVPQGSVLGPLLFVLYTTEIGKIVEKNNLNHHSFADDSQIYSSCHPSKVPELNAQLLSCISEITDWTKSNRLQINPPKTEFIWCMTARLGKTFNREPFRLGDVTVEASTSVRNLGAYIDSDMSMTTHINHLVWTCFYNLRRIKHIRRFITTKTAILLVNSFVISRVDYCNSLLAGLPNCHLHRIQLVLNAAARLLYRGQKRDHITPLLRDKLHWLDSGTHPIQNLSADIQVVTWLSATVYSGFFETRGKRVASIHAALSLKRIADHTCNQNCIWHSSIFRHWANLLEPTSRNREKRCNCKYIQATSQDIFV